MESPARQISLVPPLDRRQSETALAIARGTARLLRSLGFSCISELPLPSGRRADLVALNERGEIWIVEIKSSVEDLRADQKWQDYRMHCDRLFFAFTQDLPCEIFPARHRADHRRRLWRAHALRGARASPAGGNAQIDDGAFCDGGGAADQPAGRSAGAWRSFREIVARMSVAKSVPTMCDDRVLDGALRSLSGATMAENYRGARLARIRCRVRRCMFSRRAVSETLRLHIS